MADQTIVKNDLVQDTSAEEEKLFDFIIAKALSNEFFSSKTEFKKSIATFAIEDY